MRYKEYSANAQRAPSVVRPVEASSIVTVHSGGQLDVRFIGRGAPLAVALAMGAIDRLRADLGSRLNPARHPDRLMSLYPDSGRLIWA